MILTMRALRSSSLAFLATVLLANAAIAANARRGEFSRVLALKPDAAHGEELFKSCISCHGPDASGQTTGSVPRIAGQHYRVLVRQVIDFRQGRRWDMRMEGIATSHEVMPELQDVADVAAYVSSLDRDGARGVGDGQFVERGAPVYQSKCASCHGAKAEGSADQGIPRLAGQHAAYLTRQIYDAVDGRRPPLSHSHGKIFSPLEFEEVLGLTDYLSRIGWNAGAPGEDQR